MADQIPIKVLKAGSDTCGLAQFSSSDNLPVSVGGTGLTTQGICAFAQPGINAVACKSTYIGICAGKSEGAADENTYVGYGAGQNVTTGCYHTIIGSNAGDAITTCHSSVLIGYNAGTAITFGDFNTLIGTTAGAAVVTASNNTAVGYSAATATICSNNVAVGTCAMVANTQGQDNVAIGLKAGATQVAAGCNNVFIGSCVGAVALCQDNTLVGAHAGVAQTTATGNVMLGVCVGYGVVGGAGNVYLGYKSGLVNTSGNNNVFIGNCAGVASTASCCLIIGNGTCDLITGAFNTPLISMVGCVGIGVTPVYHVHSLLTGSAVQTNLVIDNAQAAADGVGSAIVFVGHTGGQNMATVQSSWTAGTNCGARLQFRTRQSGTETTTMTLDESGNVGIGTASPGAGLDVAYSGTDAAFRVYNSQATNPLGLLVDNTGGNSSDGNYVASYRVGGTAVFQIMNSGNVGIGTTGPGASLHIYKDMAAPDDLGDWDNYQLVIQGGSATGCAAGILLASSIDTYGGSAMVHYDTGSNGKGDLVFYTKQAESASAPTEVMRLDDAGKVGIGTTAPASILHIEQSPLDYLTMTSAGVTIARLGNVVSSACIGDLSLYHNGNRCARIVADTGDSFISGKFGIGTGAPEDNFNIYSSNNIVMRFDSQKAASGSTIGPTLELALTAGTGDPGQAGDMLGSIQFDGQGNDNEFAGAVIRSKVVVGATTRSAMSSNLEFLTMCAGEAGASNVRMTIDPDGNVGIGTAAPAETLHVQGNVCVTGCTLQGGMPWFRVCSNESYPLTALTGDGTNADVCFGGEICDNGGNFNGMCFIAPVAGVYSFSAVLNLNGITSAMGYMYMGLFTSNVNFLVYGGPFEQSTESVHGCGHLSPVANIAATYMDAADVAKVKINIFHGGKVVVALPGYGTTFTGALLG